MRIQMEVIWFDRGADFKPDYTKPHHGSFCGETPAEIMAQYHAYEQNHDLEKFSRLEIVGIF